MFLTKLGVICKRGLVPDREITRRTTFTVKRRIGQAEIYEKVRMCKNTTAMMDGVATEVWLLPRALAGCIAADLKLTITSQFPATVTKYNPVGMVEFNAELSENQRLAATAAMTQLIQPPYCAILQMGAGLGKTRLAAWIARTVNAKALFITNRKALKLQAWEEFCAILGDENVGKLNGAKGVVDAVPKLVTVTVINSVYKRDASFFAAFDFIMFDEVHSYCAKTSREVFYKCNYTKYILGLTATVGDREDGLDFVYLSHLGINAGKNAQIDSKALPGWIHDEVVFDTTVQIITYHAGRVVAVPKQESTGNIDNMAMLDVLMEDQTRMNILLDKIHYLYNMNVVVDGQGGKQHNIYVFCEKCSHVAKMRLAIATKLGLAADAPEIAEFKGGLKDDQINNIKATGRILICTYGYAGTGVSIDKMTAMVFATPRKGNMKQIVARILRRRGDIGIPRVLIDIIDAKYYLRKQFAKRLIAYDHYNIQREYIKVKA
ncbi:putative ATP-dependent RNA helicase [Faustovirus]|nr:putative ATP-dependent RNA helicase [Faustovirus]